MNEILNDIETLTIVRNAVSTGVEKEKTLELLDKVIRLKSLEITNFETQMEMEFMNDGINRSEEHTSETYKSTHFSPYINCLFCLTSV